MNLFQKLLKKPNDEYRTTPFRNGKRAIHICSLCGNSVPGGRMDILPYERKTITKLPRLFFSAFINKKKQDNLVIESSVHSSESLVYKTFSGDKQVSCNSCGAHYQSVVAIKIFDIVVLLCM